MVDSLLLTFRNTKDVLAVYFDGKSASLSGDGMDLQIVFL